MATSNQPTLSDEQLAELEKLARAQERSVDEVLGEAVDKYIKTNSGLRSSNTDARNHEKWA